MLSRQHHIQKQQAHEVALLDHDELSWKQQQEHIGSGWGNGAEVDEQCGGQRRSIVNDKHTGFKTSAAMIKTNTQWNLKKTAFCEKR